MLVHDHSGCRVGLWPGAGVAWGAWVNILELIGLVRKFYFCAFVLYLVQGAKGSAAVAQGGECMCTGYCT